ncbi:hypothetical protein N8I77_013375 [Diaporthe amygdali]|uniref:Uncharacterized protein n=1 Tax=Phomopsis amygdali TaxID=1214568 RepID=A0AAD9S1B5_PHOAM|nr:hypothetical protein N8I77_013375 [Diaporthe amygdali]
MKPRVVLISLSHSDLFEEIDMALLHRLSEKATVQSTKKPDVALDRLREEPPPAAVLITDAACTRKYAHVWDAVIAYVRQGGIAIAVGQFSSFVKPNDIGPFFAKAGLEWASGAYHRTTVTLKPQAADIAASGLRAHYSQKAVFLTGVHPDAVVYGPDENSVTESQVFPTQTIEDTTQAAIAFAGVGNGKIGYVGDVNHEEGTNDAILAMCRLAN